MRVKKHTKQLEQLKKCAVDLARIDTEARARSTACKELATAFSCEVQTGQVIEDPMAMFKRGVSNAKEKAKRPALQRAPEVLRVQSFIERIAGKNADEDDVQVDISSIPVQITRCPLTGKDIENPVKNVCGHVYSLEGIIQFLFQRNHGLRRDQLLPKTLTGVPSHFKAPCPYTGCTRSLTPSSLKRDFAVELSQRQKRSASARKDSLDADPDELELL